MTEQAKELPQVEEPTVESVETEVDVAGLMAQLEQAGVTSTDELQGKLTASKEAGNSARLLGESREEARVLREQMAGMNTAKPQAPQQDFMEYGEGQTINIEDAIEKSVTKVFTKQAETQRKAQEAQLGQYNRITQHPNYGFVKDEFEAKLKDPNYVYQVQSGMVDPVGDFYDTVIKKQQILMKESHKTITQLAGGGKIAPPHVETGERSSPNLVSENTPAPESVKLRADMKAKIEKGYVPSHEEELAIIDSMFDSPPGPPPK